MGRRRLAKWGIERSDLERPSEREAARGQSKGAALAKGKERDKQSRSRGPIIRRQSSARGVIYGRVNARKALRLALRCLALLAWLLFCKRRAKLRDDSPQDAKID